MPSRQPNVPTDRAPLMRALFRALAATALVALPALAAAQTVPDAMLDGLQWRLVGPFRGGWSTMAVGIPDQPDTYFFAAAGGGVWKSNDAGQTWKPTSDGLTSAPVGAIAVAPSDANVLYVGTGHPEPRYDIAAGDGVYKSTDGGKTWKNVGLAQTKHIGAIRIDAHDANIVLVAALGHVFGSNAERGVFRTTDGGKTWTKTLFVDNDTGAVDIATDPTDPNLVYASTWTARVWPWLSYFTPIVGAGSAIYKSTDGGKTWAKLGGEGWPSGKLGRIGIAAAHTSAGARLYASVDAPEGAGFYRSDDGGAHWQRVSDANWVTTWYMSRITVSPADANTVYTIGQSVHRSTDAGKTWTIIKGAPGGDDYHYVWINPKQPERMVVASDQGTAVSLNGGASWSDWYNQPTGQFYHLAADNRFPYWIYSGQQDSGTVGIASRSDYGAIGPRDWHPVGGDERDYDIPDPTDADIIYGSGLGGRVSRWDKKTGEVQNVTPWPVNSYGQRPTDYKYRYTWITPLVASARAPYSLYLGAQVLFRSTDQGAHWEPISPDLSAKKPNPGKCDGDLAPPQARDCGYGVIYSIAPSANNSEEIWVGTDDGLVQLTRDGGKHWSDVTPKAIAPWSQISTVDLSPNEDGAAYIAVDNHRQDDFRPHVYRTHDYGARWVDISKGLPAANFVSVVRVDPIRKGLLYAGTDAGVFVSLDDGDHWQRLQRNLPVAWVRDLLVHGNDLIAATQGRSIWILDDVTPLRGATPTIASAAAHLYTPSPAIRVRNNEGRDTPPPADTPLGKNPPSGAVIDFWLARDAKAPLSLEIKDASGKLVGRFTSADKAEELHATKYFADAWVRPTEALSTKRGAHRFVWNLRQSRPRAVEYAYSIGATFDTDTPIVPEGMLVPPGDYKVELTVDGKTLRAPLVVTMDPRVKVERADLDRAMALSRTVGGELERAYVGYGELKSVTRDLKERKTKLGDDASKAALKNEIDAFLNKAKPLASGEGESAPNFGAISEVLAGVEADLESADRAPAAGQEQAIAETTKRLDAATALWSTLRTTDLDALNAHLAAAGVERVVVPKPEEINLEDAGASKDLP